MARGYREVDFDQVFLLPPSMRDWLPAGHLVWFVIDTIRQLDLSRLREKSKRGGPGRAGYDPAVLLGLWIYASARGISSSRQIERACHEDIAFRVLCAQDVPDHTVLARFRQTHEAAMADLFAQVLRLCVTGGLGDFGVVAIDGTKIVANASKHKTLSLATLRRIAAAELDRAAVTDAAEDAANAPTIDDEVPPGLGPGSDRGERIRRALAEAEQQSEDNSRPELAERRARLDQARMKLAAAEAAAAAKVADHDAAAATGTPRRGHRPRMRPKAVARAEQGVTVGKRLLADAEARSEGRAGGKPGRGRMVARNITDPDSRLMSTRNGFVQAYNAQLAVTNDHLITVATMTTDGNDLAQFVPVMDDTVATAARLGAEIGVIVADAGYLTQAAIDAPGPDRLIAPGRITPPDAQRPAPRPKSGPAVHMAERLADPTNKTRYARRGVTVEPINGHLKDRRGLRRLARRGLAAVQAELHLAALTNNLLRLHTTTATA